MLYMKQTYLHHVTPINLCYITYYTVTYYYNLPHILINLKNRINTLHYLNTSFISLF